MERLFTNYSLDRGARGRVQQPPPASGDVLKVSPYLHGFLKKL